MLSNLLPDTIISCELLIIRFLRRWAFSILIRTYRLHLHFGIPNSKTIIVGLSLSLCVIANLLPLYSCAVYVHICEEFPKTLQEEFRFISFRFFCRWYVRIRASNTSVSNLINSIFHCDIGCQRIKVCWTFSMLKIRSASAPHILPRNHCEAGERGRVREQKKENRKNFSNVSLCSWKILCAILSIFSCT